MTSPSVPAASSPAASFVDRLVALAVRGLPASFTPESMEFSQTVRAVRRATGLELVKEGSNLRYAAIVALGLARHDAADQSSVLAGHGVLDLVASTRVRAARSPDPGAVALAAWAAAEVTGTPDAVLLERLWGDLASQSPLPTVDTAWMLAAAVASLRRSGPSSGFAARIADLARDRLLEAQAPSGLFPHAVPASSLGRWRAHVSCFADQVYPIQSLSRLAALQDDQASLAAANAAAQRICGLQGSAGQWWWHYDVRNGSVVERFPVYSVHQHAMAPMALFDLAEAGGKDHTASIMRGLGWLETHPEVLEDLVSDRRSQVWRKVGRLEPAKAARRLSAITTSLRSDWHLPGIDALLPANQVDYECRPYELGWLLYAWPSAVANADTGIASA
jgi:hypothetical protein